jgi:DNA-directed RNA polymerase I, II, and III subunit RPABC2
MPSKKILADITKALFPQDEKKGGAKDEVEVDVDVEEEEEEDVDNEASSDIEATSDIEDGDDIGVNEGEGEGEGGEGEEGEDAESITGAEEGTDIKKSKKLGKSKNDSDDDDDDGGDGDDVNKCYPKFIDIDEDIDIDEYFNEEDNKIIKNDRISKPILTKYEKVRLLSDRTRQLAQGAKPMIKNTSGYSHKEIARMELVHKLIPLIIERPIPNVGTEKWKLSELEIFD